MASNRIPIFISLLIFFFTSVTSIPEDEVQSMLTVLRSRSYSLFCNALVTTDIYYDVLNGNSFTFFVPTDISLYSLDMAVPAPQYIAALRRHVIPRRLSVFELPSVSLGHSLHTMDPNVEVHVGIHPLSGTFTVEGIEIVLPGLFYGPNIAVHGLGGILNFDSRNSTPTLQQNDNLLNNGSSTSPITGKTNRSSSSSVVAHPPAKSPVYDVLPPPYESFSRHHKYGDGDALSRSREIDDSVVPVASPPVNDMSHTFSPPPTNSRIDSVPVASPTTEISQIDSAPATATSDTLAPFNSEIHSNPVASPVIDMSNSFSPLNPESPQTAPGISPAYGLLEPEGKHTPRRESQAPSSSNIYNPSTYFPADSDGIVHSNDDDYFRLPPLIKLLDKTKLFPMTQHEQENGDPKSTVQSPPAATTEMPSRLPESESIDGQIYSDL